MYCGSHPSDSMCHLRKSSQAFVRNEANVACLVYATGSGTIGLGSIGSGIYGKSPSAKLRSFAFWFRSRGELVS